MRAARRLIVAVICLAAFDPFVPGLLRRAEPRRYEEAQAFRFQSSDLFGLGPLVAYLREHPRGERPRGVHLPDLRRLQRRHGRRDRVLAHARHHAAGELQPPVPRAEHPRVLKPVAHDALHLGARLHLPAGGAGAVPHPPALGADRDCRDQLSRHVPRGRRLARRHRAFLLWGVYHGVLLASYHAIRAKTPVRIAAHPLYRPRAVTACGWW